MSRSPDRQTARPTVLLLPGMTLNATIFPRFDSPTLSVDFTTLILGSRGYSPELDGRRMERYVDELERWLDQRGADLPRGTVVVGHSFGGMLALAWLLRGSRHAAGVSGLILVATTAGPMYGAVRMRIMGWGRRAIRVPIAGAMRLWNRPRVTRAVKRLTSNGTLDVLPVDFQKLTRTSDLALDLAGWRNTDWRSMRSFRLAMDRFDVRARLKEITLPTIVLHGDRDALFPVAIGRELAAGIPNGEFRLVEGAGHGLPLTHGEAVLQAVKDLAGPKDALRSQAGGSP